MQNDNENSAYIGYQIEELKVIYTNLENALTAQKNTFNIFIIISTAIIATSGTIFSHDKELSIVAYDFIYIILLVIYPIICYFFCGIWLGEVKRMVRSGRYISSRIKKLTVLNLRSLYIYGKLWDFEDYNKEKGSITLPYLLHIGCFMGCGLFSSAFALQSLFVQRGINESFITYMIIDISLFVLSSISFFFYCLSIKKEQSN